MIHPKFYKYALLTNLILCGGLFIPLIGQIENRADRYLPFDIFQAPGFFIKRIVDWKFHDAEALATWNSYGYAGPLLNLISSSIWIFITLFVVNMFRPKSTAIVDTNPIWKTAYKSNLIISLVLFALWLPMTDSFITGISDNPLSNFHFFLLIPFSFFGIIPGIIGSFFLESGGDTTFGFSDTQMLTTIASSFGVTAICVVIAWIQSLLVRQKPAANIVLPKSGQT